MAKVYDPIMCMMVEQKTNDVMFKPGQVFKNGNGYELKIDSYTNNGKINVKQNGRMFETTEASLQNIISKNGYSKVNDTRTCDVGHDFNAIYNSFASSIRASKKMDPKTANTYVGKIMKGCIDDLDKEFRIYSQAYNALREKIMSEGQKEMSDIFERYLKEGKK